MAVPFDSERAKVMARLCCGLTLDVGSGPCQYHDIIGGAVGLDFSKEALKRAKPARDKVCATCEHMPFADCTFDSLFVSELLEHLEYPDKALVECKRVVKAGGTIVVSVPNKWLDARGSPSHRRAYDVASLVTALSKHFIKVKSVEYKGSKVRLVAWGIKP